MFVVVPGHGLSDPLVTIECDGFPELKTAAVDDTTNPAFNTTFVYPVRDKRTEFKRTHCLLGRQPVERVCLLMARLERRANAWDPGRGWFACAV